ncbi:MAG: AMP-binding protein [Burkholderiales bacterium]
MFPTLSFDRQSFDPSTLETMVLRAAGGLQRLGVEEGDTLALMSRNQPALLVAMLAARTLGAYFCAINWHFKAEEAGYILGDSGAKALIADRDLYARIAPGVPAAIDRAARLAILPEPSVVDAYRLDEAALELPPGCVAWEEWLPAQPRYVGPPRASRGFVPYTSGTTGRPKGVRRVPPPPADAARLATANAALLETVFGIRADSRCLIAAPLYHSAPSSYALFAAARGAWLRLEPRFDAEGLLAAIERHRVTHLYLVPTMMHRLLRLPGAVRAAHDLSSLRFVLTTGAPCPPQTKRAMIDWFGPVVHEAYAASELGWVTSIGPEDALVHPGSVGRPLLDASLRIVGDDGRECPPGTPGRIYARQPAYPDFAYINLPEARAQIERDGLVSVGDVGFVDADGWLHLCDRAADMVLSGGVNIYPAEIEAALASLPGVADSAVFGIPDDEYGESLIAVVERQPGATVDADAVRRHLSERLADYKVPRTIEVSHDLPREDSGKIFKRRLREPYWAGRERRI